MKKDTYKSAGRRLRIAVPGVRDLWPDTVANVKAGLPVHVELTPEQAAPWGDMLCKVAGMKAEENKAE